MMMESNMLVFVAFRGVRAKSISRQQTAKTLFDIQVQNIE